MRFFLIFLIIESLILAPIRATSFSYFLPNIEIIRRRALLDLKRFSSLADDPLMLFRDQRMHLFGKMEVT